MLPKSFSQKEVDLRQIIPKIVLLALCLLTFGYFAAIGKISLFDWDEFNFAVLAKEMVRSGEWYSPTVNYELFHEKPPLFTWLQAISTQFFGPGPFAARFPNVLCGLATIFVLFHCGRRSHSARFGAWWAAFFALSLLPSLYFRSGIIDPWYNLFTFLALWPLCRAEMLRWPTVLLSGLALGAAVLTKGPAAGLVAGLVLLGVGWRGRAAWLPRTGRFLVVGVLALVPIGLWLVYLWPEDGGFFAREFLTYQWRLFSKQDAGHGGFPGYHAVILLLGAFPASVYALPALLGFRRFATARDSGQRWLFWTVLVLFSVVSTKIVHYSSLCYFPLTFFAARSLVRGRSEGSKGLDPQGPWGTTKVHRYVQPLTLAVFALYALASTLLPAAGRNLALVLPHVTDAELLSRLALPVAWPWYTYLPALSLCATLALLFRLRRHADPRRFAAAALLGTALFTHLALWSFTGRLQTYSQGAATEFFAHLPEGELSVGTAYYKSYAHWYYAGRPPDALDAGCRDRQCRFHGPNPLDLYFASPLRKRDQVLREVPDAELLYERGGFAFYRRPSPTPPE